jgi:sec-independent protein translocase protein TatA
VQCVECRENLKTKNTGGAQSSALYTLHAALNNVPEEINLIYGLGMQELLIILAIVMLLFGGKRLPELGKGLGKAIRGFKQAEEETVKELKRAAEEVKSEEAAPEDEPVTETAEAEEGEADVAKGDDEVTEKQA